MRGDVRRDKWAWLIVVLFLALYALVGTMEARDYDMRQPVRMVAR